jgi:hypothetical protein
MVGTRRSVGYGLAFSYEAEVTKSNRSDMGMPCYGIPAFGSAHERRWSQACCIARILISHEHHSRDYYFRRRDYCRDSHTLMAASAASFRAARIGTGDVCVNAFSAPANASYRVYNEFHFVGHLVRVCHSRHSNHLCRLALGVSNLEYLTEEGALHLSAPFFYRFLPARPRMSYNAV